MDGWKLIDPESFEEDEIGCESCGNSNSFELNEAFDFYRYTKNKDYHRGTVMCRTCLISDGIIKE